MRLCTSLALPADVGVYVCMYVCVCVCVEAHHVEGDDARHPVVRLALGPLAKHLVAGGAGKGL